MQIAFFLLIMHILVTIILLENYWISYRKLSLYSLIPVFAKDWFIYPMSFVLAYEFLFKSYTFLCERITHGRRDEEKDDLPSTASLAIWSQWLLLIETRTQKPFLISHVCGRSRLEPFSICFPKPHRYLDRKYRDQVRNRCPYGMMKCRWSIR